MGGRASARGGLPSRAWKAFGFGRGSVLAASLTVWKELMWLAVGTPSDPGLSPESEPLEAGGNSVCGM